MATIITRPLGDDSNSYRATVTIGRKELVVRRESHSSRALDLARRWTREREYELNSKVPRVRNASNAGGIAALIDRHVDEFQSLQNRGRTKEHHLRLLEKLAGRRDA